MIQTTKFVVTFAEPTKYIVPHWEDASVARDSTSSTEAAENVLPTQDTTPTEKYADSFVVITKSITPSLIDASALKGSTSSMESADNAQQTPSSTE